MQCIILHFVLLQVMGLELITVFFTTKLDGHLHLLGGTALHDFIYKAQLHLLSDCLISFISFRTCNLHTHSQEFLILNIPNIRTEVRKTVSQVCAPQKWNDLQRALELNHLISLDSSI